MNNDNYELDSYQMLIKEISKFSPLTKEDNIVLCSKYIKEHDNNIRQKIINGNLRLVLKVAQRYSYKFPDLDILDLFQEGTLGLMNAIDNYNPDLGSFSNYAFPWIRQAVSRFIKGKKGNIKIPLNLQEKIQKYKKIYYDYKQMNKTLPDDKTLATLLDVTLETLQEIKKNDYYNTLSLNQHVSEDSDDEVIDFVPSYKNETDELLNDIDNEVLFIVLKNVLNPLEYFIVYTRILSTNRMTLDEVATYFNLTRERVRQLEEKSFSKLKKYMFNDKEKLYETYKIISKDIISLEHYRLDPYSPNDIIEFLMIKPLLSTREIALLYELRFGNYNYSLEKHAQIKGISYSEMLEMNKTIEEKINQFKINNPNYENQKREYLKIFGTYIFEQLENHEMYIVDYFTVKEKYDCLSYEKVVELFNVLNYKLTPKELILLEKYFEKEKEIMELNELKIDEVIIQKIINFLMLIVSGLKDYDQKIEFTYEEIERFYSNNKDNMFLELKDLYLAYLNSDFHKIDNISSKGVTYDYILTNKINLTKFTKDNMVNILKKHINDMEKDTYLSFMRIFTIVKRDFMNSRELNQIFILLNNLEKLRMFDKAPNRKRINSSLNG